MASSHEQTIRTVLEKLELYGPSQVCFEVWVPPSLCYAATDARKALDAMAAELAAMEIDARRWRNAHDGVLAEAARVTRLVAVELDASKARERRLMDLLILQQLKGHDTSCLHALSPEYECDCGHDAAAALVKEQKL